MESEKIKKYCFTLLSLLLLAVIIVICCFPFVLMISGSFKEDYEIFTLTPNILPRSFSLSKYQELFRQWPFLSAMANSVIVTVITTLGACLFCTMAGFTFAKYRFPGKNFLFMLVLATLMLPLETRLVPTYLLFRAMGGANKLWSLILPGLVPAFGIFMLRSFAANGVPTETMEAARIEGATETRILFRIAFPMLTPAIFSLAILIFMNTWNDFLWPIIIISRREQLTVTALLRSIGDVSMNGGYGILLAATTLSVLPILVLYLIFNRQMVKGIIEGSGKE